VSETDIVLMRIDTLIVDPKTNAPVMVLRGEQDGGIYLPICIGQLEAAAIASVLAEFTLPRPMTHDLFSQAIETLGARISRVVITRIEDDTFYAEIEMIGADGVSRIIDARPSDSVALALRSEASIYVAEAVLAEAGGYADDTADDEEVDVVDPSIASVSLESPDVRLEDLDADTFGKYKM
jgi:bifunctional DNase/RNase